MVTDRKNKRHFCAGASGVRPPEHPGTACQRTPLALVVHAPRAGRRSTASLWCWTCAAGRGMVGPSGATRGAGLGKGGLGKAVWEQKCKIAPHQPLVLRTQDVK